MRGIIKNKRKIINDPVCGFINITDDIIFDLIEHRYFQRLRRIKQLGLTYLVYPCALHTRFSHAIGAMHLMTQAIDVLRSKGHNISDEESLAVKIAILLHDIGHGPFSHALENTIIKGITHEDISEILMNKLNKEYSGKLELAIKIFKNKYHKKYLHQLVSSQLDMDRLDYLRRDSFFTGVSEGVTGTERIIKMLNVKNNELAVDYKGIYSIENFIIARRLMYWQVYLHKTVISAEYMVLKILKRAKELSKKGDKLFTTPVFSDFLYNEINKKSFEVNDTIIEKYTELDDYDIFSSIKVWTKHDDKILSMLCKNLINRVLYKIELQNNVFDEKYFVQIKNKIKKFIKVDDSLIDYFVFSDYIESNIYSPQKDKINILLKNGDILDITEASDQLNVEVLSKIIKKYFICYINFH